MFKELKIIKLLVLVLSLVYIFPYRVSYDYQVVDGYSDPTSTNDKMDFHLNAENFCRKNKYKIYNISGEVVDSVIAPSNVQSPTSSQPWKGFDYQKTFSYSIPANMEGGMYLLNKRIPFLVRGDGTSSLAVVFPISTIQAYNKAGGKNLIHSGTEKKADSVGLLRPYRPDAYTKGLFTFLKEENIKADYLTDLDLEAKNKIARYQTLVIYGNAFYTTTKAKKNFKDFVLRGGNAIIISSQAMSRNDLYYSQKQEMISYSEQHTPSHKITHSYSTSKVKGRGFKVYNPSHPLLKGISLKKGDSLKISSSHYAAFLCQAGEDDKLPDIRRKNDETLADTEIAAYNLIQFGRMGFMGTYKLSQSSGTIIQLGTKKWCLEENLKKPVIRQILMNAFAIDENTH